MRGIDCIKREPEKSVFASLAKDLLNGLKISLIWMTAVLL